MPSSFAPFGLSCVGYLGASKPRSSTYDFPILSGTAYNFGSGEPVALSDGHISFVSPATANPPGTVNELILGVWQSVEYQPSQANTPPATFPYWVAGTTTFNAADGMVAVSVDPFQIYNVQANGSLTVANIGNCFNLGGFVGGGAGGNSVVYLNTTAISTSGTWGQVKLIGLAPTTPAYPTNNWTDSFPIVQVVLNNTQFKLGQYSYD